MPSQSYILWCSYIGMIDPHLAFAYYLCYGRTESIAIRRYLKPSNQLAVACFQSIATMVKVHDDGIACSSAYTDFEVIGIYEKMSAEELDGCYAISTSGAWSPIASGASLNPFRLYMTITNRDGSPVKVSQSAQARINIRVQGEDNATGITETENGKVKTENFDLSGRRVERMQKGIYIVNGKKVVR